MPPVDCVLVLVRTIHFVSTMLVGGVIVFEYFIASPAIRAIGQPPATIVLLWPIRRVFWVSLVVVAISGAAWLFVVSSNISGAPLFTRLSGDAASIVLTQTQFGHDWMVRGGIVLLLAGWLAGGSRSGESSDWPSLIPVPLAAALLGTLAWAGHAAATPGRQGVVHLSADVLHLVSAGAWVGGLLPLALLLASARRQTDPAWQRAAAIAVRRFSTLGLITVAVLVTTGIVNTWALVGSSTALVESDYGRLLLLKIACFIAMVSLAAVNRLALVSRFETGGARRLERNTHIEAGLGFIVVLIVGLLGTMAPASHMLHGH